MKNVKVFLLILLIGLFQVASIEAADEMPEVSPLPQMSLPPVSVPNVAQANPAPANPAEKDCKTVPLNFESCLEAMCTDKAQFGTTIRKTVGKNSSGGCDYQERTQGFGGLDCTFAADKLPLVNNSFGAQYFGRTDIKLTDLEKGEFKGLMSSSCKPVKESGFSSPIDVQPIAPVVKINPEPTTSTSPLAAPTEAAPIEKISPSPAVAAPTSTPVTNEMDDKNTPLSSMETTVPEVAEKTASQQDSAASTISSITNSINNAAKGNISTSSDAQESGMFKSLMFTPEELAQINGVLNNFKLGNFEAKDTPEAKGGGRKFFLNSIIFYTTNKWSVWVNNLKISNDTLDGGLQVKEIDKDTAVLEWTVPTLDTISPDWKNRLTNVARNKYVSAKKDIEVYIQDETSTLVTFKLSPNQLFEVTTMKIKEGEKE